MPESIDIHIKNIQSKLQLLLKKYAVLKKENSILSKEIDSYKRQEKEMQAKLDLLQQQVHILKSSSGKLEGKVRSAFEKSIGEYIKAIERCIGMLNN